MANADKGNIEVISGSIGDLIFRVETLSSDRDTIKLCVRAAAEYDAMRAQLTKSATDALETCGNNHHYINGDDPSTCSCGKLVLR